MKNKLFFKTQRQEWIKGLKSNDTILRRKVIKVISTSEYNKDEKKNLYPIFFYKDDTNESLSTLFYIQLTQIVKDCNAFHVQSDQSLLKDRLVEKKCIQEFDLIKSAVDFLWVMYFYEVDEDTHLYELLKELINSKIFLIRLYAPKLIHAMIVKINDTKYINILDNYFKSFNKPILIDSLLNIIGDAFQPFINARSDELLNDINEYNECVIWSSLLDITDFILKENLSQLNANLLKFFLNLMNHSWNYILNSLLLILIESFLNHANLNEIRDCINYDILRNVNECFESVYKSYDLSTGATQKLNYIKIWKRSRNVHNILLNILEKNFRYKSFISNEKNLLRVNSLDSEIESENYVTLFHKYHHNAHNKSYAIKENEGFITISLKYREATELVNESNKTIEHLKSKLDDSSKEVAELKRRIEGLEKEKEILNKKNDDLRQMKFKSIMKNAHERETLVKETDFIEPLDEEKAKEFIIDLYNKNVNSKEFSAVKNLNHKLYKEKDHFFSEIMQNFIDNSYDDNKKLRFAKIILNKKFIIFCNNENGFKAKDVLALCNISSSKKEIGKQIGNKGIGFKSVFVCSDNPIIISQPWKFQFKIDDKNDSSYVTPYVLHDSEINTDFENEIRNNPESNTLIYLPLKKSYSKCMNEIRDPINPYLLLFSQTINEVSIENNLTKSNTKYECKKEKLEKKFNLNDSKFLNFECVECVLKCIGERETNVSFKMYEVELSIPQDLRDEAELKIDKVKLSLAFPNIDSIGNKFHVFNVLPVEDLGFKFAINAYWILTTNRDGIIESYNYNMYLRDNLIDFFNLILNNEEYILRNINLYLPSKDQLKLSSFWEIFYDDLLKKLGPIIRNSITQSLEIKNKTVRVFNNELKFLLDDNILYMLKVEVIGMNDKLDEASLKRSGIEKISINDILACFKSPKIIINKTEEWWEEFFRFLNLELLIAGDSVADQLKDFSIFLIQNDSECIKRSSFENIPFEYFYLNDDPNIRYYWKNDLKLVNYKSKSERTFLDKIMTLPVCSRLDLVEFTIKKQTYETIHFDLNFIKENLNHNLCYKYELKLPTIGSKLVKYDSCLISSLFGIDLTLLTANKNRLTDYKILINKEASLSEIFEWECFLIDLNCEYPNDLCTDFKYLAENIHKQPNILNNFELLDSKTMNLAYKLLDKLKEKQTKVFKWLTELPLKLDSKQDDELYVQVNKTFLKQLNKSFLPSIDVPVRLFDFYSKLGVNTHLNTNSCLKSLEILVENNQRESYLYIELLDFLNKNIKEKVEFKTEFICLKDFLTNNYSFYSSDQIFFIDDNEQIEQIKVASKYIKLTFVNSSFNSEFYRFQSLFLMLGSHNKMRICPIINAIENISKNDNNFEKRGNFNRILRDDILGDLLKLYASLECYLNYKLRNLDPSLNDQTRFDYKLRKSLSKNRQVQNLLIKSKKEKLYLISKEKEIIQNGCNYELVCIFDKVILKINDEFNKREIFTSKFIYNQIAIDFPILVSLFKPYYIESLIDVFLEHNVKFKSNKLLNDYFQNNKINIRFSLIEPKKALGWKFKNEPIINEKKAAYFDDHGDFIIYHENNIILSSFDLITNNDEFKSILDKLNIDLNGLYENTFRMLKEKYNWNTTNQKLNKIYPFESVLFPNMINLTRNKMNYLEFISNYDRIKEIVLTKEISQFISLNQNNDININNQEALAKSGIEAEKVIDAFLNQNFNSYNPALNWKSIFRRVVYPHLEEGDDTLGYDFEITDDKGLFLESSNEKKLCYLEVKGTVNKWNGNFYLTENERKKMNAINKSLEKYFIVLVDCVFKPSELNIYSIECDQTKYKFDFKPKTYLVNLKRIEQNLIDENQSSTTANNNNNITHNRIYPRYETRQHTSQSNRRNNSSDDFDIWRNPRNQ